MALVLVVVGVAYFVILDPPTSLPRDTLAKGFLDLKTIDVPLKDVIGIEPTEPGNAAQDYQKAVQLYMASADAIEATGDAAHIDGLVAANDPWSDPGLKACKDIAAFVANGVKKKSMQYTFQYSPKRLKFSYHQPHSIPLFKVAVAVHQCFQVHRDRKEYAEAEKHVQQMMIFGAHLVNERVLPHVGWQGIEIQTTAIERLQQLYRLWDKAPRGRLRSIDRYGEALRLVSANFRKKKKILWDNIPATDPVTLQPVLSPGDIFNVALNDQDRAWRAQAIIALGAVKFRITGRGDLKMARKLIKRSLVSKEAVIKAAGEAADRLTIEEFRHSGTNFDEEVDY